MNERLSELALEAGISILYEYDGYDGHAGVANLTDIEKFAKLIVEETLKEVDERTFCRGETSWYDDDKKWIRLHFGYGELAKWKNKT